jgi:plastocyanin domain-containing protein
MPELFTLRRAARYPTEELLEELRSALSRFLKKGRRMDASEIAVTLGGLAAIGGVIWYFFLGERKKTRAEASEGGVQHVRVVVKGGYEPDVIVVEQGRPVRLDFYRDEATGCSDTVVFADLGIARPLAAFETTPVEFVPGRVGEFTFTCGMSMLRGKLIVEPQKGVSRGR